MGKSREEETELFKRIKEGNEQVLKDIYYKYRDAFSAFLMKYYQANKEDALEVYPKSFTTFYFNIRDGKLELPLKSSLKTYLLGIGKHYFHKRFFNKYTEVMQSGIPDYLSGKLKGQPEITDYFEQEWKGRLIQELLEKVGEPCKQLITLSFLKGYGSEALAKEMDIPTEGAARRRKSYCLGKLRELVESSERFREYLEL